MRRLVKVLSHALQPLLLALMPLILRGAAIYTTLLLPICERLATN